MKRATDLEPEVHYTFGIDQLGKPRCDPPVGAGCIMCGQRITAEDPGVTSIGRYYDDIKAVPRPAQITWHWDCYVKMEANAQPIPEREEEPHEPTRHLRAVREEE